MPPKGSGGKRASASPSRTPSKRVRGSPPDAIDDVNTHRSLRSHNLSPSRRRASSPDDSEVVNEDGGVEIKMSEGKYGGPHGDEEEGPDTEEAVTNSEASPVQHLTRLVQDLQDRDRRMAGLIDTLFAQNQNLRAQLAVPEQKGHQQRVESSDSKQPVITVTTTNEAQPTTFSSFSSPLPTVSSNVKKLVQKKLEKFKSWQPSTSPDAVKVLTWLSRYELWVSNAGGTEQHMLELVGEHLDGTAFDWYRNLPSTNGAKTSWPKFKMAIRNQFQPMLPLMVVTQRLRDCKKLKNESYQQHLTRFQNILSDLPTGTISDAMLIQHYLETLDVAVRFGMRTRHAASLDSTTSPPTIAQLSEWAMSIERDLQELNEKDKDGHSFVRKSSGNEVTHHVPTQTTSTTTTTPATSISSTPRFPQGVSPNYKGKHPDLNYQYRGPQSQSRGAGAKRTTSPPPTQTPPATNATPSTSGTPNSARVCFGCGQPGHYRNYCPLKGQQGGQMKKEGQK